MRNTDRVHCWDGKCVGCTIEYGRMDEVGKRKELEDKEPELCGEE
jgi:hypothetical protein